MPRRVIGSGFDGGGGGGFGLFCGSGASGSEEVESALALTGPDCGRALWAEQSRPVASKREAVRHRDALSFVQVKAISGYGTAVKCLNAASCWRLP